MKKIARIGLDLAKDIFQIHAVASDETLVLKKRVTRDKLLHTFEKLDREDHCIVGMESCCGSDHWARALITMGYDAKIMNPSFVKPYVKSNKNDANDAAAICEAVSRRDMRFVPVKTIEQQDMILSHRFREQLMRRRTAQVNQIRGLLMPYGIVVAKGISHYRKKMMLILENASAVLSVIAMREFHFMHDEFLHLDQQLEVMDQQIAAIAKSRVDCRKLMTIPGVGPLVATAVVAWLGDCHQFNNARECSAYLGIVPKQHSSGNTTRLGGISKRGNRYLRQLLVLGAKTDLYAAKARQSKLRILARDEWSTAIELRRHANVAAVALANKNARIIYALLRDDSEYRVAA
jgi:transposase